MSIHIDFLCIFFIYYIYFLFCIVLYILYFILFYILYFIFLYILHFFILFYIVFYHLYFISIHNASASKLCICRHNLAIGRSEKASTGNNRMFFVKIAGREASFSQSSSNCRKALL